MKCMACGYVRKPDVYEDKEVKYHSGKKKGQVKTTERVLVQEFEDFVPVKVMGRLDFTMPPEYSFDPDTEVEAYACPECGTMRLGGWRFHTQND